MSSNFIMNLYKNFNLYRETRKVIVKSFDQKSKYYIKLRVLGLLSTFLIGKFVIYQYHKKDIIKAKIYITNILKEIILNNKERILDTSNIMLDSSDYNTTLKGLFKEEVIKKIILVKNQPEENINEYKLNILYLRSKDFILITKKELDIINKNKQLGEFIVKFKQIENKHFMSKLQKQEESITNFINMIVNKESSEFYSDLSISTFQQDVNILFNTKAMAFDVNCLLNQYDKYSHINDFLNENSITLLNIISLTIEDTFKDIVDKRSIIQEILNDDSIITNLLNFYFIEKNKENSRFYTDYIVKELNNIII